MEKKCWCHRCAQNRYRGSRPIRIEGGSCNGSILKNWSSPDCCSCCVGPKCEYIGSVPNEKSTNVPKKKKKRSSIKSKQGSDSETSKQKSQQSRVTRNTASAKIPKINENAQQEAFNKSYISVRNEEHGSNCTCHCCGEKDETKIKDSCADFLTIVHDAVLETVQNSIEAIMRDHLVNLGNKVQNLCSKVMRNECMIGKMYMDLSERMEKTTDCSTKYNKLLYRLLSECRKAESAEKCYDSQQSQSSNSPCYSHSDMTWKQKNECCSANHDISRQKRKYECVCLITDNMAAGAASSSADNTSRVTSKTSQQDNATSHTSIHKEQHNGLESQKSRCFCMNDVNRNNYNSPTSSASNHKVIASGCPCRMDAKSGPSCTDLPSQIPPGNASSA